MPRDREPRRERVVALRRSPRPGKKWRVTFADGDAVDFGQRGAADFTTHRDPARMVRYLARHRGVLPKGEKRGGATEWARSVVYSAPDSRGRRERWGYKADGAPVDEAAFDAAIRKAGFWARWLLWSRPSLDGAIEELRQRFGLLVHRK